MSAEANVKPIRIMLKTNINGQKEDVPFTKALLSHPDYPGLSETEGFNEYPYISDDVSIPIGLNTARYFERVQFFFDKEKFRSLTGSQPIETDDSKKSEILNSNVKTMLDLLFLTAIPASANVKDSYSSNISDENESWLPNLKFNKESVMELLNTYYFSYLKIGGNEYTVNRIVWLNDVINNPMYSTLFADFEAFKTSSIGMLNKLLADKKRLFIRILEICQDELGPEGKNSKTKPDVSEFKPGAYKSSYDNTTKIITSIDNEIKTRQSERGNARAFNQYPDTLSKDSIAMKKYLEDFKGKVGQLGKLGWITHKFADKKLTDTNFNTEVAAAEAEVTSAKTEVTTAEGIFNAATDAVKKANAANPANAAADVDVLKTTAEDARVTLATKTAALESAEQYNKLLKSIGKNKDFIIKYLTTQTPTYSNDKTALIREHKQIQEMIDTLEIDKIYKLMDAIDRPRPTELDEPLKEFIGRLYKLNKQNKETIVAEVYRIDKNDDGQSTSNAYIKDASAKMKTFTSDERKLIPYTDEKNKYTSSTIQDLIDNYVYNKTDAATAIDTFIGRISNLKKQNKPCEATTINQCTDFYIGVSQLQSIDPKLPTYEITVQCDVFGGVLDATNIKSARCIFKDKKLTKQFINWRRNIKTNRLKVIPGPYFDLKDIKPKETVKQRPIKGGRRTLKRFKRR
jgi:hypothetical protein